MYIVVSGTENIEIKYKGNHRNKTFLPKEMKAL
jgi:hypothetical protein